MDISCDPKQAKRFASVDGNRWYFRPQDGDVGIYELTLIVTLNMAGHPPRKDEFYFKVVVWDDIKLPPQAYNSTQDELTLY